jgi:hypothetical protein
MKCPACGADEMRVVANSQSVFRNLENYGGSARVRVSCCEKLVRIAIHHRFSADVVFDQSGKDDWGN